VTPGAKKEAKYNVALHQTYFRVLLEEVKE